MVFLQEIQEEPQASSEWIGYNTMIRFKEKGLELVDAASPSEGPEQSPSEGLEGVEHWSLMVDKDPQEDELGSDDSWGSVVDTGVEALQHLVQEDLGRYA